MQNLVAAADPTPQTPQPPAKEKKQRISKPVAQAIELIATGAVTTQKAAAERVGMTPEHLCRMLSRDHVRVFLERRARQTIAAGVLRAGSRLIELIDASSEHVSSDVARHVLAIHGIKPAADANVSVNVDIKAGFVIDLSGSTTQSTTIDAKPLK